MIDFFREPLELNPQTRTALPGQFVTLPDGVTHYELTGPEDGQVVVLIHGFSTPMFLWDPTVPALTAAGLRVLRYDLLGRGFSDRPPVSYDAELFDRQLLHLLDALGLSAPVDLLGLSMGGAIAVNFTDRHPERVRRLGLEGPAGFSTSVTLRALALFVPVLGEVLMSLAGNWLIVGGLPRDFYRPERYPEYTEKYRAQLPYKGFKRAILSTMRHMKLAGLADAYARVGQQGRRVLLIWGRQDITVPFPASQQVLAAIPQAEFHPIDEAGHIPHYERPEIVNPILVAFFGGDGS
ncbi:MAG: alpha/beta hydrolase [Anaerolineae bacterium]|nr:alpha/beta hydrolase [Anaerolineae bacterium]